MRAVLQTFTRVDCERVKNKKSSYDLRPDPCAVPHVSIPETWGHPAILPCLLLPHAATALRHHRLAFVAAEGLAEFVEVLHHAVYAEHSR